MLQLILEHGNVLKIDILQSSIETHLRCGGIFKYDFVANLPLSQSVKKFQKSVNIWGSYGHEFSVLFFYPQCSAKNANDIWTSNTKNQESVNIQEHGQ